MAQSAPDYLNPRIPAGLRRVTLPVLEATDQNLEGYGLLFDDPDRVEVEIVRWPAPGWRPVDPDCGDEGGTTEGIFDARWHGDVLHGSNEAVGGQYVLGYGCEPAQATEDHQRPPGILLFWHANYHPDGGQLFMPLQGRAFVVPLALPGDDIKPEDFVCFRFDGSRGLYIHPDIWHEGVFPVQGGQRFFDRQGAVHARVSVNFTTEFDCLLEVPLT